MNAIVISIGNVPVAVLGCYGGQWVDTPAIDRFASSGFSFDQCFVECPTPEAARFNWWTGRLQIRPNGRSDRPSMSAPSPVSTMQSGGIDTVLIHDTGQFTSRADLARVGFGEIVEIDRQDSDTTDAVFEAAKQWLISRSTGNPFLLWIDCYGAHPPWFVESDEQVDSPIESETEPGGSSEPLEVELDEEELNALESGDLEYDEEASDAPECTSSDIAAAEFLSVIARLDAQFGRFIEWLEATGRDSNAVVMVTSDVGQPIAEQGSTASPKLASIETCTHVPLLIRHPLVEPSGRSAALVQLTDIVATAIDALGNPALGTVDGTSLLPIWRLECARVRDHLRFRTSTGGRAVRTANWLLVESPASGGGDEAGWALYSKPDDRWERNDLAKLHSNVIDELRSLVAPHG